MLKIKLGFLFIQLFIIMLLYLGTVFKLMQGNIYIPEKHFRCNSSFWMQRIHFVQNGWQYLNQSQNSGLVGIFCSYGWRGKQRWNAIPLVGKSFIDVADIYCFGTGLPISRSKDTFQYRHFK